VHPDTQAFRLPGGSAGDRLHAGDAFTGLAERVDEGLRRVGLADAGVGTGHEEVS